MSEINTGMILDGITLALRKAYPKSQIEASAIEQRLKAPAFIVLLPTATQTTFLGTRKQRSPRFDIIYFPKAGREECYRIADELCLVLEMITLPGGDKLRGTDISYEITDDVLHFFISYNHFIYEKTEETTMENLKFGGFSQ